MFCTNYILWLCKMGSYQAPALQIFLWKILHNTIYYNFQNKGNKVELTYQVSKRLQMVSALMHRLPKTKTSASQPAVSNSRTYFLSTQLLLAASTQRDATTREEQAESALLISGNTIPGFSHPSTLILRG